MILGVCMVLGELTIAPSAKDSHFVVIVHEVHLCEIFQFLSVVASTPHFSGPHEWVV